MLAISRTAFNVKQKIQMTFGNHFSDEKLNIWSKLDLVTLVELVSLPECVSSASFLLASVKVSKKKTILNADGLE